MSTTRRRFTPAVFITGAMSTFLLALSLNSTVAGFVASIQNSVNTAGTGYLAMQESNSTGTVLCNSTDGGSISTNNATCSTINKYGGNLAMVPGQTVSTSISIKNTGTVPATTFSLTPGACTQSANGTVNGTATDLCSKLNVVIKSGATTVYSGTAAALATAGPISLAAFAPVNAGGSVPFTFDVTLDSSAGAAYQGLAASQPLTWTFGS